jgi:LCP family protein required for cell wall assembly
MHSGHPGSLGQLPRRLCTIYRPAAWGPRHLGRRSMILALILAMTCAASSLAGCSPAPGATAVVVNTVPAASPAPSATPTQTIPPTATATHTATETGTPSVTPSATETVAPTATASITFTPSPVPTLTSSPTASVTAPPQSATPTITPTRTITPTPSPTLTPTPLFTPTPLPTVTLSDDWMHILLMGVDWGRNLASQQTDVIIVVGINRATKQVSILSIPRDLWVYIPTYGWSRINTAHRRGVAAGYPGGGPGLLARTIEIHFGIPIDHWVRIDLEGFARVVDALGGVEMTVACPINLRYVAPRPGSDDQEEQVLEPGVYHMDGATALRYVRTRRGSSDFDRARRQHQFLKAMWDQMKSPDIVPKIPGLWSALSDSYKTNLGLGDVLSLAPVALELERQRIRSRYIGRSQTSGWTTAEGWQVLLPDYERIQQVVASLYAPPYASDDQAAQEDARVQVRNGTYRHQLAKIGADELRWYGLYVVDTDLADRPDYARTQIVVFNDRPKTVELLALVLGVTPANIIQQPDPGQPADIMVILGEDYDPCQ